MVRTSVVHAIEVKDFGAATGSLATLHPILRTFFGSVLVNVADPSIRLNRLQILVRVQETIHMVADFSRITS